MLESIYDIGKHEFYPDVPLERPLTEEEKK